MTTTRPERTKALHNFSLPDLWWGNQRHLKCMKIDSVSSGSDGGSSGDHRLRRRFPPLRFVDSSVSIPFRFGEFDHRRSNENNNGRHRLRSAPFKSGGNGGGKEEGIAEVRVKIISDLATERDKMFRKDALVEEEDERKTDESGQEKEKEISPAKPWNLRKRRAACKETVYGNQSNGLNQINKGFVAMEEKTVDPRNNSKRDGGVVEAETKKFSVKLSKKEIEEDYMAIVGHRPPRRPTKRPRALQKKIENLLPGLYLSEVTLDAYKVS